MAPQVSRAHVAFGAAVRARRKELGWSQEGLAAEAGLHRNYVGAIERGERNVALNNILRISRVLRVPAATLIAEAERGGR
ncbi:MAG TPA: helix-turn-helix transcriptional regulator [Solirubrobacteraceae bacterium]|nr:helix-turn-helix transcriptional regulator [Solirubrobacteraceae bacterium]